MSNDPSSSYLNQLLEDAVAAIDTIGYRCREEEREPTEVERDKLAIFCKVLEAIAFIEEVHEDWDASHPPVNEN